MMNTIDIILVTDPEIKRMNRRWFGKGSATDVIAFDLGQDSTPTGEVYISVDTAKRQAKERKVGWQDELLRLAVHGTAHVEGYDDLNLADFCKMREREWELLLSLKP